MIERQKRFKIGEHQFIANFPNVGQLIDMESLKQALTNNRYGVMAQSGVASMYDALDMVDAIAFLQVVVPDVARYLNIKSYAALPPERMRQFVDAFSVSFAKCQYPHDNHYDSHEKQNNRKKKTK